MSLTVTLQLWWLLAYLAIGVATWLPLNYVAHRQISNPGPFWRRFGRDLCRHGVLGFAWRFAVQVVAWPLAIQELL